MMDIWFAWYPVRTGALAGGRRVWLKHVLRIDGGTLYVIYQPLSLAPDHVLAAWAGRPQTPEQIMESVTGISDLMRGAPKPEGP